ncbi:uncharacterized protein BXZ73DRAFT_91978 [Epithele typhae]|uniref:uncharacterized protein n=1 Tax=Epithele typhae TaxID=378194 RepID=UPI002007BB98|nr:uncharacterized protein BXZ73DRAFT_91978 [Epithele typhae]KAH9920250.1 hypothetical protein BXZ73DRAFT_91978 [Epithele typhae]
MAAPADYHLLATLRYDPQLLNASWNTDASPYLFLSYQLERLLEASRLHKWPVPQALSEDSMKAHCDNAVSDAGGVSPEAAYRVRVLLDHSGALAVTAAPALSLSYPDPLAASLWLPYVDAQDPPLFGQKMLEICPDSAPTLSNHSPPHYTAARDRFSLPALPSDSVLDVLLFNEEGSVTETSIRNIAFVRGSPPRWTTPASSTGCLAGLKRGC